MPTATVSSRGRITLPQSVRLALGLHAGTKVDFVPVAGGFKIVPLRSKATALKGRFAGRVGGTFSVKKMNEAIAIETSARNAGGKRSPR